MDSLEDEHCPDCGKYGNHTCRGKSILDEWYDEGQESEAKVEAKLSIFI